MLQEIKASRTVAPTQQVNYHRSRDKHLWCDYSVKQQPRIWRV